MTNLTVACLMIKGKGKRKYTPEWVRKLRDMVGRNLTIPHRFVCMTDEPQNMPAGVEGIWVKRPLNLVPWWLKLHLFSPKLGWTGRMLYLDLDVVVVGSLDEIANYPAEFAIIPDMAPGFFGKPGCPPPVKGYNSSVMAWDAGKRDYLFTDWKSVIAAQMWSDQCWIKTRSPDEQTFPREWFMRLHPETAPPFPPEVKTILCIKLKNKRAADELPWFKDYWR